MEIFPRHLFIINKTLFLLMPNNIDWDKLLTESYCFDLDSDFRNLRHAAGCVAIIPKQLDTPALRKIRNFFDKNGIYPIQLLHSEYAMNHMTPAKEFIPQKGEFPKEQEDKLHRVKMAIVWNLNDAIYNAARECMQKVRTKKVPYGDSDSCHTTEPAEIVNWPDTTPICNCNFPLLREAQLISDELNAENWDTRRMVGSMRKIYSRNWVRNTAWDLDKDELNVTPIEQRAGMLRGNYRKW